MAFITFMGVKIQAQSCYELVWSDEFNGTTLDSTKWNVEVNASPPNGELEYYTGGSHNITVGDTVLTITAIKENYGGKSYTSGRINTSNKFSFKYGKVEAKMKLPYGQGIWPAFWMLGNSISTIGWPNCGEIDIMEMVGGVTSGGKGDNIDHTTLHWGPVDVNGNHPSYGGQPYVLSSGKFADNYHLFTADWTPTSLTSSVDGVQFYTIDLSPAGLNAFRAPFFIILNLAVGGGWPGSPDGTTVFPQTLKVDYVRVYQTKEMVAIDGNQSVYASDTSLTYKVPFINGWKYAWTLPIGAQVIGPLDSNIVNLNWGCNADTIKCKMSGGSCLTDSTTANLLIAIKQPTITGPVFFTSPNQAGLKFSFPRLHSSSYNWIAPSGASITAGQGTDSITVTWGTKTDSVKLDITNDCGVSHYYKLVLAYGEYPYPDPFVRHAIPGMFNATDYDYGGEGLAYHDHEPANQGPANSVRHNEGVDTEFGDGGGPDVGWIVAGEWINYSISVLKDTLYAVKVRNASASGLASIGPLHFLINGVERDSLAVTKSGSWSTFHDQIAFMHLSPADTILRLQFGHGDFNISNLTFFYDTIRPTPVITSTPAVTVHGKFKITITFDKAVTGFTDADLNITNGTLIYGSFVSTSASVYTDSILPTATGNVVINIASDVCADLNANSNHAANPLSVSYVVVSNVEYANSNLINIYPNPVNGVLNYTITDFSGTAEFSIYNMVGNMIYNNTFTNANGTIDMSAVKSGSYILKVKSGNDVFVRKIMVK